MTEAERARVDAEALRLALQDKVVAKTQAEKDTWYSQYLHQLRKASLP